MVLTRPGAMAGLDASLDDGGFGGGHGGDQDGLDPDAARFGRDRARWSRSWRRNGGLSGTISASGSAMKCDWLGLQQIHWLVASMHLATTRAPYGRYSRSSRMLYDAFLAAEESLDGAGRLGSRARLSTSPNGYARKQVADVERFPRPRPSQAISTFMLATA